MSRSLEDFDRLFRDYYRPVFIFFRNRGFSPEEAEELAQETFLQGHKTWKTFRGDSSPKTWLFAIARNLWRNAYRDRSRLKRTGEEASYEVLKEEEHPALPSSEVTGHPSPLDVVVAEERDRLVRTAVGELSETLRQALLLQLDQELKYREIAEVLQQPVDRIKSWLYQARQKIKVRLEGQFGKDGY